MSEITSVAKNIRKYRLMAGYSQAKLAYELTTLTGKQITHTMINNYESGYRVPKTDMRISIAHILEVDPVELALDREALSEVDEKRLLCKLLNKYAKVVKKKSTGDVEVVLGDDFYGFALKYDNLFGSLKLSSKDEKSRPDVIKKKEQAEEEMLFWVETYPKYDPVYELKTAGKKCTPDSIASISDDTKNKFIQHMCNYQDSYHFDEEKMSGSHALPEHYEYRN